MNRSEYLPRRTSFPFASQEVPVVRFKVRQRAQDLRTQAKLRREREEKELQKTRELERIRAGKETQSAAQRERERVSELPSFGGFFVFVLKDTDFCVKQRQYLMPVQTTLGDACTGR